MSNDFTGRGTLTLAKADGSLSVSVVHHRLSGLRGPEQDSLEYLDWLVGIQLLRILHLLTDPDAQEIEITLSFLSDASVQFEIGQYRLIKSDELGYQLEADEVLLDSYLMFISKVDFRIQQLVRIKNSRQSGIRL